MTPELIAVTTRAIVIILAALAGILCIYLGWRLYFESIRANSKLELSSGLYKLTISTAAPGLFFVAFGVALLANVLSTRVEIEEITNTNKGAASQVKPSNYHKAVERMSHLYNTNGASIVPSSGYTLIADSQQKQASEIEKCNCCIYQSKKLKWLDADDHRTEAEQIIIGIDYALIAIKDKLLTNPTDLQQYQRAYAILRNTQDGFR